MKGQCRVLVAILFYLYYTQLVKGQPRQDCETKCGNITVEYPFGTSPGCYYTEDDSFKLKCNETAGKKLFFSDQEVINISHSGELRVLYPTSKSCYDDKGNLTRSDYEFFLLKKFSLSNKNSITAVGCNSYGYLRGLDQDKTIGCISGCGSPEENRSCAGNGCCQIPISMLDSFFYFLPRRFEIMQGNNVSYVQNSSCIFAFLVENGKFHFSASEDLQNLRNVKKFPVVIDWSIGNQTCQQVGNTSICSGNSTCIDSTTRKGYICRCKEGYDGNPYLSAGCQDVNECTDPRPGYKHNCGDAFCINNEGSFECKCPSGLLYDKANGCIPKESKHIGRTPILLGTTIGFLVLLLGVCCLNYGLRHRKDIKIRHQFFELNGGVMLRERLSGPGSSNVDVKIFSEEGMKTATNGYEKSRILGEGGQGTVYKGILPDNSIVAIKKSRLGDSSQVEQFINEVLVLSQINHRNVVKLLGCCLETEIPLLVYEFITNGTLYDHLHCSMFDSTLTWEQRLRIAVEIAGTLAYLHSSASIPIIHRDIKTANILLDENLTAKVADFGASRLIPMDKEQLTTMVQGTLGYLDPEYYNTGLLNEKSDVYSFGVVLMELLSGQKAICFERPPYSKHLVSYFASATKENRLNEIIDEQVLNVDTHKEIQEVAKVAVWCTRLTGDERPRMKEVAAELEALRDTKTRHGKLDQFPEPEEIKQLPGGHIFSAQGDTNISDFDSIKNVPKLDIESGR